MPRSENAKIGILPPGSISNYTLFTKVKKGANGGTPSGKEQNAFKNIEFDLTDKKISTDLLLNRDYRGVNKDVWSMLSRIYGGGPKIIRECLDIYSDDLSESFEQDML